MLPSLKILYLLGTTAGLVVAQAPQNPGPDGPRVTVSNGPAQVSNYSVESSYTNILQPTVTMSTNSNVVASALASYATSLMADPKFSSVLSVLSTAAPASELPVLSAVGTANNPMTESWFSALPTDVQTYIKSIASVETSILGSAKACATNTSAPGCTSAATAGGKASAANPGGRANLIMGGVVGVAGIIGAAVVLL